MRRLVVLAVLLVGCAEPTAPECPIVWYEAPRLNAAGDSVGTWPVGIAFCASVIR